MNTIRMCANPGGPGYKCNLCKESGVEIDHRCADASPRPEPAVGQLRLGRLAHQGADATWAVIEASHGSAFVRQDGSECGGTIPLYVLSTWPCVGIETPAGRVMVGERRRVWPSAVGDRREGDFLDFEVCHVLSDARVWISDGVEGWPESAEKVAAWPIVPGPLAKAAESAMRSPMVLADLIVGFPPWTQEAIRGQFLDCANGAYLDALAGGIRRDGDTDEELRERLRGQMAEDIGKVRGAERAGHQLLPPHRLAPILGLPRLPQSLPIPASPASNAAARSTPRSARTPAASRRSRRRGARPCWP